MHENHSPATAASEVPAVAALLLFLLLRFLPPLLHGLLYAPFQDNVFIYGPLFAETSRISLQGEHAFYLPSFAMGFPLYQSPHFSPFYPFYFFGLINYGGPLQSLYTLTYLSLFHHLILAINFYVMLRCSRISPAASFTAAALGIFAYNTEVYSGWVTIMASYSWMPLLIAGSILLLRDPGRWMGTFLVGISAGLLALASASQAVAHAIWLETFIFGVGGLWLWRHNGMAAVGRFTLSLVIAGLIAFGIAGVAVLPVYLGIGEMVRHIGHGFVLGHQRIPWAHFNETQLAFRDAPAILLHPGSVEVVGSPYIGALGLVGLVCAVAYFDRLNQFQKLIGGIAWGVGLYGLLSAFGTHLGLSYLNYHLPLLNQIREAGRHLVLFVIATVLLSGLGFDQLAAHLREARRIEVRGKWKDLLPIILLLVFVLAVGVELGHDSTYARCNWIVLLLAPVLFLTGVASKRNFTALSIGALAVSLASVVVLPRLLPLPQSGYAKKPNLLDLRVLKALRQKLPPDGSYRIDFIDSKTSPFTWGMNASYFQLDSFYNRLTPQPYDQFRLSLQTNPPQVREMLGSKYLLCGAGEKPLDPRAALRLRFDGFTLYENPACMPLLTVVHSLAGTYLEKDQVIAALSNGFNFQQSVYLRPEDAKELGPLLRRSSSARDNSQVDRQAIKQKKTNKITATLNVTQPGILVLNEYYTPAWKAHVNGLPVKTMRANEWQVAVALPAGNNVVDFQYKPELASILLVVNHMTWVLLAGLCLLALVRSGIVRRALRRAAPGPDVTS